MNRNFGSLLAGAVIVGGLLVQSDEAAAKKKSNTSGGSTTSIEECGQVDASKRDSCISRSRPVRGADLYAKWKTAAPASPAAAAASKAAAGVKAAAGAAATAGAAAVAKVADKVKAALPAGPIKIEDCSKVDAGLRDACISRSQPVSGADLYKKYKK